MPIRYCAICKAPMKVEWMTCRSGRVVTTYRCTNEHCRWGEIVTTIQQRSKVQ